MNPATRYSLNYNLSLKGSSITALTVRRLMENFPSTRDAIWGWIEGRGNPLQIYQINSDALNTWFRAHCSKLIDFHIPSPVQKPESDEYKEEYRKRKQALRSAIYFISQNGDVPLIDTLSDDDLKILRPYQQKCSCGDFSTFDQIRQVFSNLSKIIADVTIESETDVIDDNSGYFHLPPKGMAVRHYIPATLHKSRDDIKSNPQNCNEEYLIRPVSDIYRLSKAKSHCFTFLKYLDLIGGMGPIRKSFWSDYPDLLKKKNLLPYYPEYQYSGYNPTIYLAIKKKLIHESALLDVDFFPIEQQFLNILWSDCTDKSSVIIDNTLFMIDAMLNNDFPERHHEMVKFSKQYIRKVEHARKSDWRFEFLVNNLDSILAGDLLFASVFYSHLYIPRRVLARPTRTRPTNDHRKGAIMPLIPRIYEFMRSHKVKYLYDVAAQYCNGFIGAEIYSMESNDPAIDKELGIIDKKAKRREGIMTKGGKQFSKDLERERSKKILATSDLI